MKPLYTEEQLKSAKSHDKLPCECYHCGKPFLKIKHDIVKFINGTMKRGAIKYCSHSCASSRTFLKHDTLFTSVTCNNCGIQFQKNTRYIKKSNNHFCSSSCNGIYHNAHKTHGTRRSKLEVWLEQQLPSLYPSLEFHFNRKDAINAELDIYIPALKLAFELNGLFHYEPIFGADKLAQIQNNDKRKYQACIERGIELCLIDVSHQKYFKEATCKPFLKVITDIIQSKNGG